MPGHIQELWTYPIKATGGVSLQESEVDERGLKYDRMFTLMDENDEWITSRGKERFALAQVQNEIRNDMLTITAPEMNACPDVDLEYEDIKGPRSTVVVKKKKLEVIVEKEASEWFSDYLRQDVRLVRMAESTVRHTDPAFSYEGTQTAFMDNFPLLVTSQKSLNDLNEEIARRAEKLNITPETVSMECFRPSIVIEGFRKYYEHRMGLWEVNGVRIMNNRPCDRCIATSINKDDPSHRTKEPLVTLRKYRGTDWLINGKKQHVGIFGEYGTNVEKEGTLRVGDEITVEQESDLPWDREIELTC